MLVVIFEDNYSNHLRKTETAIKHRTQESTSRHVLGDLHVGYHSTHFTYMIAFHPYEN